MRVVLIGFPLVLAIVYGTLRFWANSAVYYPLRYPDGWWNLQPEVAATEVWLITRDGAKLNAWWIAAPHSRIATVFFHGNAGNLTHRIDHMRAIIAAGSSLLIPDYRGYGKSEGKPSESGLYLDADAAYQWLTDRGYAPERSVSSPNWDQCVTWASPLPSRLATTTGRIAFVILRTSRSPPVALHLPSRERSSLRLRGSDQAAARTCTSRIQDTYKRTRTDFQSVRV